MEYEVCVIATQVYRVYVEADDDDTAQEMAIQKWLDRDEDESVEELRDSVETVIDNVYE